MLQQSAELENKSSQIPVTHTEKQINPTKYQKLFVKQPVDASPPPEQELGEATKPGIGHFEGVGNCHVWVYRVSLPQKSLQNIKKWG